MAKFMSKLEAILSPVGILSSQPDRNPAIRHAHEIRLRMVKAVIDINSIKMSPRAITPQFEGSRLQKQPDIFRTGVSESSDLDTDIQRFPIICRPQRTMR
jgi:hypothetical protein